MKELTKEWGVVYIDGKILALKTLDNKHVYPSQIAEVFECDTEDELNKYIEDNGLEYPTEAYR